MHRLDSLCFLIHGFCYAEMAAAGTTAAEHAPYLEREARCAAAWRARLGEMGDTEGLAIIPWPGRSDGPGTAYAAFARSALGDRCFVLDAPADPGEALRRAEEARIDPKVLARFRAALVTPRPDRNREELDTAFHSLAVGAQLRSLLAQRGYTIDAATAAAEAWGASFEGCVTKYSLCLRRILGLARTVEIPSAMTVPDAAFLLEATETGSAYLADGLRVFVFAGQGELLALYTATGYDLDDGPVRVRVPLDPSAAQVRSKQGIRLWPEPEPYRLAAVPAGYEEPPQQVVGARGGGLVLPVSAGMVYRLVLAPVYLRAPSGMGAAEYRRRLLAAVPE